MALWGTKDGYEHKPAWLNDEEKERCFASPAGWVLKHPDGMEELLVAVKGLTLRVAAATITKIAFVGNTWTGGATHSVKVSYNEKVQVTGNPTLSLTLSAGGPINATFASINSTGTVLTFDVTAPVAGTDVTIDTQSIVLAGGTITEQEAPNVAAELAVSAEVAAAAGQRTTV